MTVASALPPRSTGTNPQSVIRAAATALARVSSPHSHCTTRRSPARPAVWRWNPAVSVLNDFV